MESISVGEVNRCIFKIKNGDKYDAVLELHRLLGNTVRFIAMQYAENDWDADDLVQEFWLHIVEYCRKSKPNRNGVAYLVVVMHNLCRSWRRKRKALEAHLCVADVERFEDRFVSEEATVRQMDLQNTLQKAIARMSETEHIVYALAVYQQATVRQIAQQLGLSRAAAGRLHKRVMGIVQTALQEDGWDKNEG